MNKSQIPKIQINYLVINFIISQGCNMLYKEDKNCFFLQVRYIVYHKNKLIINSTVFWIYFKSNYCN